MIKAYGEANVFYDNGDKSKRDDSYVSFKMYCIKTEYLGSK